MVSQLFLICALFTHSSFLYSIFCIFRILYGKCLSYTPKDFAVRQRQVFTKMAETITLFYFTCDIGLTNDEDFINLYQSVS